MSDPRVSIVVVNWCHPEVVNICLRQLTITEGVPYEVVVVDNGSDEETIRQLHEHQAEGRITTLHLNPVNEFFSRGNNLGVEHSNPASEYILLLNSDVAVLRPDWLVKLVGWAEGTTESRPSIWGSKSVDPEPGPFDIISFGWSYDLNIENNVRPEGWCLLWRREHFVELSPDLPHHGGIEEAIAKSIRAGAKCGVCFNYGSFMVHREQGSGITPAGLIVNKRQPDMAGWFAGLKVHPLDFFLGPEEHSTYRDWH